MKLLTKKLLQIFFISFSVFILNGCDNDIKSKQPYVIGHTNNYATESRTQHITAIQTAKLKAQTQKEIALINKQRDIEVETLKQNSSITKANITKDVEFKKSDTEIVMMGQTLELQKINSILIVVLLLIISLLLFYFLHKRRKDKLKMHQDAIDKELYMKDRELQAQMAHRLLDTLESKNLTPEQEARLIDTIAKTTDITPRNLIEKKN